MVFAPKEHGFVATGGAARQRSRPTRNPWIQDVVFPTRPGRGGGDLEGMVKITWADERRINWYGPTPKLSPPRHRRACRTRWIERDCRGRVTPFRACIRFVPAAERGITDTPSRTLNHSRLHENFINTGDIFLPTPRLHGMLYPKGRKRIAPQRSAGILKPATVKRRRAGYCPP